MIKEIEKGNTLIVRGPTRVTLLKGKLEVLGKLIFPDEKGDSSDITNLSGGNVIIIPSANTLPLFALEKSKLEIYTNTEENLKIIEENSIPDSWIDIKDSLMKVLRNNEGKGQPIKIMVLGISSGKTTIIKYLANNFLREGFKGGYLDSDLGQQIMYLPTTISIGELEDFVISSEDIHPEDTVFIGATFPKGNYKFIVSQACRNLIDKYIKSHKNTDFILIDTDGWIKTEAGIIYKTFFIETVDPDVIIIFHDETVEEMKVLEEHAKKTRKDRKLHLLKENNQFFYDKTKDERRFLRQSQFAKILESYRKITIPISQNDIQFVKMDYNPDTKQSVEKIIEIEDLITLPYHYVIISLLDENSNMIKLGLLFVVSREKDYVLIFSDLSYKDQIRVKKILLGSLRLSTKGNHQGYLYL
ncbi:MAG: Clp1/GlmU family protein [Promethearchaeota archaeon]